MAKGEETITVTKSELVDMVRAELAKERANAAPKVMSEDEKFHAEIASRKGTDKPALPTSIVPGIISQTAATFDALIDHNDKVRDMLNYQEPEGHDKPQSEGGIVPNGLPIREADGSLSMGYKQWLWETFRQADTNAFVGKPLPKHLRPTKAA